MRRAGRFLAAAVAVAIAIPTTGLMAPSASAAPGPVGAGFTVTTGDLSFILKQIKIAERHAATRDAAHPCSTLVNRVGDGIPDSEQVPDILTSYGLRTVDGSCNNLKAGDENLAAADQPFPRLTTAVFKDAEAVPTGFFGPGSGGTPTSYTQKKGNVVDSQPRTISNLIVDQTSTNPAAVAAAEFPVRTQNNLGLHHCTTDPDPTALPDPIIGVPAGCVPSHQTLFIPNVTTDVGLSPPYNSLFTFFGQFFDHGVDQTVKSNGTVFVPLKADDPLITLGPDGKAGTGDEVPASQAFMVLTRAQNQPGPDGVIGDDPSTPQDESADDVQNANNTDTPWVDQSQTYTSHASHQVFLREYAMDAGNRPLSTGKLLGGLPAGQTYPNSPDGTAGIGTWAAVKKQAAEKLGLLLTDADVTNIPALLTDPYGKFIPGVKGLPQYLRSDGTLLEGDLAAPVPVPANAMHFDTPFLTDIAHNADPSPQDTDHNPATPPVAPVPDADTTPSADFAHQAPGTYDDEMLNAHFSCGDGRCNENIALSTIHQIFHSEHDRLVDYIDGVLTGDTSAAGIAALAQWKALGVSGYGYGERLFQAARFVTEMEYQHLVFEEFARKVQPAVRPFHVYSPDINPAVKAEFAHAVYRFGHSMLDDTVARTNADKSDNSVALLTAFLNPPEYFNGGTAGTLSAPAAAGSIIMGSSDQIGNELDEFVTETLRNNLLGLPLDLPTLNMARAREAGVPSLNGLRRQIFGQTNDGQLAPYTSWSDFGQHLKHPESLVNFVAAYGLHPTITGATTLAGKRAAARAIVDPRPADTTVTPNIPADVQPGDAAEFMFGTGAWADANGSTTTGLDDVDLWVGGLAEITNLFGGLLGSTFNYVFETQLENLQDGDRLYYLARTPGLNLRTQLEGNSFSEIIQRNTDNTDSLKADAFATADCKFQLADLAGTPAGFAAFGSTVADDLATTDCDESKLLLRKPDGTIQYRAVNTVDPVGINGQSVYQGTDNADRVYGGNDNDTFWGGKGNDVIEGNGGDDIALGGEGNDIVTDLGGADVLKGGPGNDAIDSGIGDDITMGGDGQDFINGGANDNEHFAGPGNDFVIAGQGADAVFGDGGDDWIQGGSGQDLLQGDHGAPFFDDPAETAPGNDFFIGQVGENDYDAEGGDDVMSQNAAVDRNAGAGGFDWAFHQYDTIGADDDMEINNNLVGVPIQVVVNRDRWQETEADSGSAFNDVIKGTSVAPNTVGGIGFIGCDALDTAGVARIKGLDQLVRTFPSPLAPIVASSTPGACPLDGTATGGNVWAEGDILLGGAGSDSITGRGADDIIDGDRFLQVAISVRTDPADPATETGRTDLMEHAATSGTFGAGTSGMTLQAAVFAGLVDPGKLVAVREIVAPTVPAADCAAAAPVNCDKAVFLGPQASYTITPGADGSVVVTQTGAVVAPQKISDGTDTLRNIEQVVFSDGTVTLAVPAAVTIGTATASNGSATVGFTAPDGGLPITGFSVEAVPVGGGTTLTSTLTDGTATTATVNGLLNGTSYQLRVAASNALGTGPFSALSNTVVPSTVPGAPTIGVAAVLSPTSGSVTWTAPANNGGSAITGYSVRVLTTANLQVGALRPAPAGSTSLTVALNTGQAVHFTVSAINVRGSSAPSASSNTITPVAPATAPNAPLIGTATAAGSTSVTVRWTPPASNGSPITGYSVRVLDSAGTQVGALRQAAGGATNLVVVGLTAGQGYHFTVTATNGVGTGPASANSNTVTLIVPGAPVIGTATAAGLTSITVRWTAPVVTGSAITGYSVRVLTAAGATVGVLRPAGAGAVSLVVTGLTTGQEYHFTVTATNGVGTGPASGNSNPVALLVPTAPIIGTAVQGANGGAPINATARWTPGPVNAGPAVTGYRVTALRLSAANVVLSTTVSAVQPAAARSLLMTLPVAGNYRFTVTAINAVGTSPASARSNLVAGR